MTKDPQLTAPTTTCKELKLAKMNEQEILQSIIDEANVAKYTKEDIIRECAIQNIKDLMEII